MPGGKQYKKHARWKTIKNNCPKFSKHLKTEADSGYQKIT